MKVLYCNDNKALQALCLQVLYSLENIKRGSLSKETKVNSLLGYQLNKTKYEIKSKKEAVSEIIIERDRIVMCNAIQLISNNDDKKEEIAKQRYRILATYVKVYSKQYVTANKQRQSKDMKEEKLKKY